jgi:HTH-type transcriptional regulator/antitoxin HigA
MNSQNWYLIEKEQEYENAISRYLELKYSEKGTIEHKEKLLLTHLISEYEDRNSDLPDVDPIETIKIRMEDFGYNSTDLAKEYGDKGTVSKVLNYKQALSITMIRKFSEMLHIPIDTLVKKYDLKIGS